MSIADKISQIEQSYNGKDYQMVERLEAYNKFSTENEFKNYLLIILVMIEKSEAQESAATLLWKKIFQEQIGRSDTDLHTYGDKITGYLKELAVFPYRNLATTIGRLIATIIYDVSQQNTRHITSIIPRNGLLNINEYLVGEHIKKHDLNNDLLTLSYNCIDRIEPETFRIFLSERGKSQVRTSVQNGQLDNYLSYFIRPYYSSMSSYATAEARYHVAEPFHVQFFGSSEQLMEMIGVPDLINRTLRSEVWNFLLVYQQNIARGIPYVDIGQLHLTKKWHHNVRFGT
jgi:hypothetical protein